MQSVCSVLPANANVFAGQGVHRFSPIAPVPVPYFPAWQSTQVPPPVVLLYFPAGHATHPTPGSTEHTLLKGVYWVNVLLMCEKGIHIYEPAEKVAKLTVHQSDSEIGIVSLPHHWADAGKS